jgi:hypothetical protein
MLRSVRAMLHADLEATDGAIGRCEDFLFDDASWTIRYMVADTRKWLSGRKVLISPGALSDWDWRSDVLPVRLSRDGIRQSPPLESHMPVSRQYEKELTAYYGWTGYWDEPHTREPAASLFADAAAKAARNLEAIEGAGESHLRSIKEVTGYHIEARDDAVGHVEDFLLENLTWTIRYLIADTRNWLPGRKVLLSPAWAGTIDWKRSRLHVGLDRRAIESSPVYDRERPLTREDEETLFKHYDARPYWLDVP